MNKRAVIIQGSSNSNGETRQMVDYLVNNASVDFIDLKEYQIGQFDYNFSNQNDDFLPLIKRIAADYDLVIFATPVYWYSMSGIMKKFFDRISDCLKIEKETGRKLRGKEMAVISSASGQELKDGFLMPFKESANYLGMTYLGNVHGWVENDKIPKEVQSRLEAFVKRIF